MGDMRTEYKILAGNQSGRSNPEEVNIDDKMIIEWILGN
jgi:hypothetical protein